MPVNKLNLSSEAKNDLAEIKAYISMELNNPQAAASTLKKITKTMRMLRDHAAIGVPLYAVTHDDDGSQRRFLTGGDKVKVIVKFKGREMSHLDVGRELLERFREACADLGGSDKAPSLDGRFMSVFITPNSKREGASAQSKGKGKKPAATAAAATPEDKSAEK